MTNIEKNVELAFASLKHSTNLLITLSTSILALGITFSKELLGGVPGGLAAWLLVFSFVVFILSIIAGMMVNMAITGTLEQDPKAPKDRIVPISTRNGNIILLSKWHIFLFLGGLLLLAAFGLVARLSEKSSGQTWLAEGSESSQSSDLGLYSTRESCINAIEGVVGYRCKLVIKKND